MASERDQLIKLGRQAMACQFEIVLPPSERSRVNEIHRVFEEIDRFEQLMTVYREDSHLSEINRCAHPDPVRVDPDLWPVLELSIRLWSETSGAFDITSGPLTRAWGFFLRRGRLPHNEELRETMGRIGTQHIELNQQERTIRFTRQLELNLGSIGKGYALDRAAALLQQCGVRHALMHAGNSSILAFGSKAERSEPGWKIGVRNPRDPDSDLAFINLQNRAMATSGIAEQRFTANGREYGHIIDPRTGRPAEGNLSATAVAATAAEADALSTAFFVMRLEEVTRYCDNSPDKGALLVTGQPEEHLQIHSVGLDSECVEVSCET
jgi:thiamine biosynthesis lipoprotein